MNISLQWGRLWNPVIRPSMGIFIPTLKDFIDFLGKNSRAPKKVNRGVIERQTTEQDLVLQS